VKGDMKKKTAQTLEGHAMETVKRRTAFVVNGHPAQFRIEKLSREYATTRVDCPSRALFSSLGTGASFRGLSDSRTTNPIPRRPFRRFQFSDLS
jgi:hypothetical protein